MRALQAFISVENGPFRHLNFSPSEAYMAVTAANCDPEEQVVHITLLLIQPVIAVELARLRCFIELIDERGMATDRSRTIVAHDCVLRVGGAAEVDSFRHLCVIKVLHGQARTLLELPIRGEYLGARILLLHFPS